MNVNKSIVVIHGGGYVGLTAAVHYAKAGWSVIIYDPDIHVVNAINKGTPRAGEFLSYIDTDVKKLKIIATNNFYEVVNHGIHSIAVPTEKNGQPYDNIVEGVVRNLVNNCLPPVLILIESTLTPGTTDRILSQRIPKEVFIAVCPRVDWFSDKEKNLATLPRAVGGINLESTDQAVEVISTVSQNILRTNYRTAELCKAFQNHLYHVQIMAAYELASLYPDRDVATALSLACTHWRLPDLYLGFGTGGRCVPLGSKYIDVSAAVPPIFCKTALQQDDVFRTLIAQLAASHTPKGGSILILGIAYRPDFKDAGSSPGLDIARILHRWGQKVFIADPMWSPEELSKLTGGGIPVSFNFSHHDTILLATPHTVWIDLPGGYPFGKVKYILDGQGIWAKYKSMFEEQEIRYVQVGTPGWLE